MPANYHPSDTTEIVKSDFVSNLETRYVSALNAGGGPLTKFIQDTGNFL